MEKNTMTTKTMVSSINWIMYTLVTFFAHTERSYAVKCSSLRMKEKTLSSSSSGMGISNASDSDLQQIHWGLTL